MRYITAVIRSFRNKGLKELFERGRSAAIPPQLKQRCLDRLEVIDAATKLDEINLPGYSLHTLNTDPPRHAIAVNGPWRITFEWEAPEAIKVDLEQYH